MGKERVCHVLVEERGGTDEVENDSVWTVPNIILAFVFLLECKMVV